MLTRILLFFLICPFLGFSQNMDSLQVVKQVDSLCKLSNKLAQKGNIDQALELLLKAENVALENQGPESAVFASCCYYRGKICFAKHTYAEAEKWFLEARDIQEKVLGKEHSDYAWTIHSLGVLYSNMAQYEKAEMHYKLAMDIWSRLNGKDHPTYTMSLNKLGNIYVYSGNFKKAEAVYLESKGILEKTKGKENLDYAKIVSSLGLLYWQMGKFQSAEPYFLEALAIRQKALGKEHPDYAISLNDLGNLYYNLGQYEKAELLYLEALSIREKVLGKEHKDYAASLHNLAALYSDLGQFEKAEPLYLEAKDIRERVIGKEHRDYYKNLTNLGILYSDMGQYEKAEAAFLEALDITRNWGEEDPDYAKNLENLGCLYLETKKYDKAEPFIIEAKEIREKVLGKEHPDYASSLSNLAILYGGLNQSKKEELLYLEAKAIREKVLGKEHPDYASILDNLGAFYYGMQEYDKAKSYYLEAKAIREKVLGKEHRDYTFSVDNLAILYAKIGQYEKAEELYSELANTNQLIIAKTALHLSAKELGIYMNKFLDNQDQTLSFAQRTERRKAISACYDNLLFYKGFLLNAANQIKKLAYSDSLSSEQFNLLKSYERRLSSLYSQPIAERDSATVSDLELKANKVEKDLARSVAGWSQANRQVQWKEVQSKLKPDEAVVEFVHFRYWNDGPSDSIIYAALVLRPEPEGPKFVKLCSEKQIASLFMDKGAREQSEVYVSRGANPVQLQNFSNVYELIWKPLEITLSGVKKVWIAPSGTLHRLNFNAIPTANGNILSDQYDIVEFGSSRQLVIPPNVKAYANEAVLFGGLKYQLVAENADVIPAGTKNNVPQSTSYQTKSESLNISSRGATWEYLPGTKAEVDLIANTLENRKFVVKTFQSNVGTEELFKQIGKESRSPRILHLATHGFFFPDPKTGNRSDKDRNTEEPIFKISENPMIRSGLILAGGNHAWQTGKPLRPEMEDGILTAYEISQMNLSNTELVVLSACETGLGDVQGNEGVFGLQRAFKIAGAQYLIMSLWQVPDQETSQFMSSFYKNLLEHEGTEKEGKKRSIPEAFRMTQKEMREQYTNPYLWAGFVLLE